MTTEPERNDLLAAAASMTEAISGLGVEIRSTAVYGKRNRRLIGWVAVSVVFDVLLSLGLAYGLHLANQAADEAAKASSTVTVSCVASNASRDIQKKLWDTVLSFPAPTTTTPEEKARQEENATKFRAYIAVAFAPLECEKTS